MTATAKRGRKIQRRSFGPFTPAFTTKRLRVFRMDAAPSEQNHPRCIFIACRNDEDRPMVTATAVVWEQCPYQKSVGYMDWIEVTTQYRREGFAEELWRGIEKHLGRDVVGDGATPEGDALCDKMCGDAEIVRPGAEKAGGVG